VRNGVADHGRTPAFGLFRLTDTVAASRPMVILMIGLLKTVGYLIAFSLVQAGNAFRDFAGYFAHVTLL
jgi:hypothetical protein